MEKNRIDILTEVAAYYSAKLMEYGATPRGVDWNGEEGQILRFEQLTKVIQQKRGFSLNDMGCGYGALYDYLRAWHSAFAYTGCDISSDMILAAQSRLSSHRNTKFIVGAEPPDMADYGIASGIFNVKLGRSDAEWYDYVQESLNALNRTSRIGFAFNCLTVYSDNEMMRSYLYYADPCTLFDLCKRRYSRHVSLLHDYGLYEFTIIVRKSP